MSARMKPPPILPAEGGLRLVAPDPAAAAAPDGPLPQPGKDHDTPADHRPDVGGSAEGAQIILRSIPFCPRLQRAMVALAARNTPWQLEEAPDIWPMPDDLPLMIVRRPGQPDRVFYRTLPMLDAIEALHPGQAFYPADTLHQGLDRALMQLGRGLQIRLSDVTHARDSVDHDMARHRLTIRLHLIENALTGDRPRPALDNPGVVFAPTLWRMLVLDRQVGTHLLTGYPRLAAWARMLSVHPAVLAALGPSPAEVYMSRIRARNAVLVAEADRSHWDRLSGGSGPHGVG